MQKYTKSSISLFAKRKKMHKQPYFLRFASFFVFLY